MTATFPTSRDATLRVRHENGDHMPDELGPHPDCPACKSAAPSQPTRRTAGRVSDTAILQLGDGMIATPRDTELTTRASMASDMRTEDEQTAWRRRRSH